MRFITLDRFLLLSAATLMAGGLVMLAIGAVTAQRPEQGNPDIRRQLNLPPGVNLATPEPRPDASSAVPLSAARTQLATQADVGAALLAMETGDVDGLLAMTRTLSEGGSEVVIHDSGGFEYRWTVEQMRDAFAKLGPMPLSFASRVTGGPEYFLAFNRTTTAGVHGIVADGIGLRVRQGAEKPIVSFSLLAPEWNALEWVQIYDASRQTLITPPTLDGWRGQGDHRIVPEGYFD